MLQSTQRFFRLAASVAIIVLMLGFAVFNSPAQAADTPSQPALKVYDATPTVPIPAGTFSVRTLKFHWSGVGRAVLSSRADGTGDIYVYDTLKLNANAGLKMAAPNQCFSLSEASPPLRRPWDITNLLNPGLNQVVFEIWDNCGLVGNSEIYLANPLGEPAFTLLLETPAAAPAPVIPPSPKAEPVKKRCGPALFFGVRGSGESRQAYGGYGRTVSHMRDQLALNLPGLEAKAIEYEAIPVNPFSFNYSSAYVDSVEGGVRKLLAELRDGLRKCPTSYALLAGYSQGAEVVGFAYGRLTAYERQRVASVTLYGDPRFNPAQTAVNHGDYSPHLSGIDIAVLGDLKPTVPAGWESRVRSYCTAGDPICNFDPSNLPACTWITRSTTCAHSLYFERGWVSLAAKWSVDQLRSLPRLT